MSLKHTFQKVLVCGNYCHARCLQKLAQTANVWRGLRFSSSAMSIVDLRSDTLTHPTPKMRDAMRNAKVGDDVFGEDPTVNKLQEVCAEMLGKEAALLIPTCTMANNAAMLVHCSGRFNEVILGDQSHMHLYEVAAMAQLGGIQGQCVPNLADGTMDLQQIKERIRPRDDDHQPWTKAICIENTHNRCGGKVLPLEYIQQVARLAKQQELSLHLDGARVFNAAVTLKVPVSAISQHFDSISICFSKGLCCPAGSVIAGNKDFIDLARRVRKALGGGMRQAGVLAAPMLVALEDMVSRLWEDHDRAFHIAKGIEAMEGNPVCSVDMDGVHSNIVMIDIHEKVTPAQFADRLKVVTEKEKQTLGRSVCVQMCPFSANKVRYVTHHDICDDDVENAVAKIQYVIQELSDL